MDENQTPTKTPKTDQQKTKKPVVPTKEQLAVREVCESLELLKQSAENLKRDRLSLKAAPPKTVKRTTSPLLLSNNSATATVEPFHHSPMEENNIHGRSGNRDNDSDSDSDSNSNYNLHQGYHHRGRTHRLSLCDAKGRLNTMTDWKIPLSERGLIANAGFYYECLLNKNERIVCRFCDLDFPCSEYKTGVDPFELHKLLSPNCTFIKQREQESKVAHKSLFSINEKATPMFPDYVEEDSRLQTFESASVLWPRHFKSQPDHLSKAGFFYVGPGTKTACFQCGGIIIFEERDDAFVEHGHFFSKCQYIAKHELSEIPPRPANRNEQALGECTTARQPDLTVGLASSRVEEEAVSQCTARQPDQIVELAKQIEQALGERLTKIIEQALEKCTTVRHPNPIVGLAAPVANSNLASSQDGNGYIVTTPRLLCKICFLRNWSIVLCPCGHVVCNSCAPKLTMCPFCRRFISSRIKAYSPY